MATMEVTNRAGGAEVIEKPNGNGRAAAAAARPVVLSVEDKAALDAITRSVPVDFSTTLPGSGAGAGTRKIVALDPDREALIVTNPSTVAMQLTTNAPTTLDGTVKPGIVALAPGASVTIPGGGELFAWCTSAQPVTVMSMRRDRPSRRTLASPAFRGMPSVATAAGDAERTYFFRGWTRSDCVVSDIEAIFPAWAYTTGNVFENDFATYGEIEADIEFIRASDGRGDKRRLRFNGQAIGRYGPGLDLVSDVLPISMAPGTPYRMTTCLRVASGATIVNLYQPTTGAAGATGRRDEFMTGNGVMRTTHNNNQAGSGSFGPMCLLGTASIDNPKSAVMFVDSIGVGAEASMGPQAHAGWVARVLHQLNMPYVKVGRAGLVMGDIVGPEATHDELAQTVRLRRLLQLIRPTHGLIQVGSNDLMAMLPLNVATAIGRLVPLLEGKPIALATILPRLTGVPANWTSTAAQTRVAEFPRFETYNALLAEMAAQHGFSLIDAYAAIAEPGTGANYGFFRTGQGQLIPNGDSGAHASDLGADLIANNAQVLSAAAAWRAR